MAHNSDSPCKRHHLLTLFTEQTLELLGQNPICASAVCIPSLLVPTLQWSRWSGHIGNSRNHNGHHPDSSHSHVGDEQQGALAWLSMLLKRETFFYCRWQNTYFVLFPWSRWSKGILESQWEVQFRTFCHCNKLALSRKIQFSSVVNHCVIISDWCLCSWASCCTRWTQGRTCQDTNTICMISHSCSLHLTHSWGVS